MEKQSHPSDTMVGTNVRETQVSTQISSLHDAVQFLDENLTKLEKRLSCITQDELPREQDCAKTVGESLVPVAEELYSHRTRVNRANERLCSLFERLEV